MKKVMFWTTVIFGVLFVTSPIVNSTITDMNIRGIAMSVEVIIGTPIAIFAGNKISEALNELMVKERA